MAESQRNGLIKSCAGEEEGSGEDQSQEDVFEDELTMHNIKVMTGIIEAIVLLWNSISVEIDKTCNEEMLLKLKKTLMVSLPEMFKTFNEPQIVPALILISGNLPPK